MTSTVAVVGAGVIGLTTAVSLAESGRSVTVLSADPVDHTTSITASAMTGPNLYPAELPMFRWEQVGRERFAEIAADPGSGVVLRSGLLTAAQEPPQPMTLDGEPIVSLPAEELPDGYAWGFRHETPIIHMGRYLSYLQARLAQAGGTVRQVRLDTLTDAGRYGEQVMNCAGLGARELCGDEAVTPVRGQHLILANPGIEEFFMEAPFGPTWVGIWPHGDTVVLGCTADEGDGDLEPRPEQADKIRADAAAIYPALADAPLVAHQVGLRPARAEVRLEAETVDGLRVVHNYGHGGSGVSWSWGTVAEAIELLDQPG